MPSRTPQQPPEPPRDDTPPPDFDGYTEEAERQRAHHFTCLGYDHGVFFFLAHGAAQVLAFSDFSKSRLMQLAPLSFWEREWPSKKGADWDAAANALIRWSEQAGVYRPERVRGRGAWFDDGRHVLHLGDRIVAGRPGEGTRESAPHSFESKFIYEAAPSLRLSSPASVTPLAVGEANRLIQLTQLLNWQRPVDAALLAGWCVVAPICGALKWRPHVWVTGPAGSGKSYVYDRLLRRCLGEIALAVASETTEAGLRQALRTDARPVLFDEAEQETAKAAARIQNVLALMRQASSETSARIIKGTATGVSQAFEVRSCFAFSSIGVGLTQHADMTRVSVLSLTIDRTRSKEERGRHFDTVIAPAFELLTDEYIDRLHARTVGLIPVIRANAETFARAGAAVQGSRRFGDQLGALLAGAYSLHSDREVTLEQARAYIERHQWEDETEETKDEVALLRHLLQTKVRVVLPGASPTRTVAELITIAARGIADEVQKGEADAELQRMGIRVVNDAVHFSNRHRGIAAELKDTPWSKNWCRTLSRLDNAEKDVTQRFAGIVDRCVALPLESVIPD